MNGKRKRTSMRLKLASSEQLAIVFIVCMLASAALIWIVCSRFEAKVFNRLTGAHTTTCDAMWVELRVQDSAKSLPR